jgi:hypothetical protein
MTTFKTRCIALLLPLLVTLAFSAAPAMAEFGLERLAISARNQDGTPDVQAGSHPYSLNTTFVLHGAGDAVGQGDLRDVRVELPPGFVGDPTATPRCAYQEFIKEACSAETQVGLATAYLSTVKEQELGELNPETVPVYNIVPPPGVAAEFGYIIGQATPVLLETSVRAGGDYGLTATVSDINQSVIVGASKVTIWGVPANPAHNPWRGACERAGAGKTAIEAYGSGLREGEDELEGPLSIGGGLTGLPQSTGNCPTSVPEAPLLTNPTSCGTPRTATLSVDDWQEPGNFATEPGNLPGEKVHKLSASLPEIAGCGSLNFSPTLEVKPDGEAGSTPTGLNVGLHVPQEATVNPAGSAEADVKDTTVTLPAGMQLSPSAADGLQACSNAQVGFERYEELDHSGTQTMIFKPKLYNPTSEQEEATLCPNASKIATVKIKTPLLEGELTGSVFLAAPQNFTGLPENPFSSLVAMYLVAEEKERGVEVKIAGHVEVGEPGISDGLQPGQIRTTFENIPQFPVSETKLEFYGTDRAPLATPAYCGTYGTAASLQAWSGTPAVSPVADFNIASGPNGGACPGSSLPFSPSLATGTPNINAGSFSDLTTTFSREDGQQGLSGITLHYPPGLSGILTGIPLCGEAQANAGTCGSASEIGETIVSVGEGNDPFSVTGGKVYLTEKYDGAPFGLSIVNPAQAGPFDLQEGRPVIVRAKIEIDPLTAALTVTTTGEIPHIIDGIPLQIKHINVNITRPGFTFNPTSCNPVKVEGTITSFEGASSTVSDPFQVTNCQALKFEPKVQASTSAKTSKADGASLTYKVAYPHVPQGTDADIRYVKVELPKQLPSRLTTLQKACTQAQFQANPGGCPSASVIGHAKAIVPNIPVPIEGPVYFVSNGGEAFPNLVMVLQGYGVRIDLIGDTFISKSGITSTTFKAVPDNPVTSFEINLPEGPYSALAANGNLCSEASKLLLPNEYISQAGQLVTYTAPVSVAGCKAAITVVKHSVKKGTATIVVAVPAAGKLTATGKGVSRGTGKSSKAQDVTVKVHLSKQESAFLSKHHSRKLSAHIKLSFTPKTGAKLSTTTTVLIG